jgi:hypothetical protein
LDFVEEFEREALAMSARKKGYGNRDEVLHTNLKHAWLPTMLRAFCDSRPVSELVKHYRGVITQRISKYPRNDGAVVQIYT